MAGPVANRVTTQIDVGPGLLYIAKIGSAEPSDPDVSTWDVAWVELGYTDAGSTFAVEPTTEDVNVAEETDPVLTITSKVSSTVDLSLAQITAFNLAVAFAGGTVATPTGLVTFEPPVAGAATPVMLGWASVAADEAIIWRRCLAPGSLNLQRQAGANKALIPVKFKVLAVTGAKPWIWIADNTKKGPAETLLY